MLSKTDAIAALVVGELSAWLLIAITRSLDITSSMIWGLPIVFPLLCLAGLYIAALIAAKIAVIYQIAKFVLIGGFNTLVDWGILAFEIYIFYRIWSIVANDTLLTIFSFSIAFYSLFKAVSFVLAATNSYFLNKFWTFKRENAVQAAVVNTGREFAQFFLVTFIGFLINVFIASGIFSYVLPFDGLNINQWAIVAAVFATAISMAWNFLGYKFIVFSEKPAAVRVNNI